jgi:hypothetical protein
MDKCPYISDSDRDDDKKGKKKMEKKRYYKKKGVKPKICIRKNSILRLRR